MRIELVDSVLCANYHRFREGGANVGFGRKALLLGGALALGAAISAAEQAEAERVRKARQLNGDQLAWLTVLAVLALGVAVGLAKAGGGFMVVMALVAWAYALRGLRNANERRARQPVVAQTVSREARKPASPAAPAPKRDHATIPRFELERRQREQQRRESVARRDAECVKRVEDLGPQGSKLYERAETAVRRILSTEALRSGRLGDLQAGRAFGNVFDGAVSSGASSCGYHIPNTSQ